MYCTVLRPFGGPDGMIAAGQVVDTSTWRPRNLNVLIKRHWLRPEPTHDLRPHGPSQENTSAPSLDDALEDEPEYRAGRAKRAR